MFGEVQVGGIDDAQADALSNPNPSPIPIPKSNPNDAQADALFDVIDADGSGVIDADELRAYLLGGGDHAAQIKNDAFDTLFQVSPIPPYISPTSPLHLPYISPISPLHLPYISTISHAFDTLFQSLDLNRDGVICRDELREGCYPYPYP